MSKTPNNSGRLGIFKQADNLIDMLHNQIIENIKSDMTDEQYKYECRCEHNLSEDQEPIYEKGFIDGLKSAVYTIEMFRDGDL